MIYGALRITSKAQVLSISLLFTCAVKVNVYEMPWAAVSLAVGGYMLLRQFVLVPFVLQPYDREQIILAANLAGAALLFAAGANSLRKSSKRRRLQKQLAHPNQ